MERRERILEKKTKTHIHTHATSRNIVDSVVDMRSHSHPYAATATDTDTETQIHHTRIHTVLLSVPTKRSSVCTRGAKSYLNRPQSHIPLESIKEAIYLP